MIKGFTKCLIAVSIIGAPIYASAMSSVLIKNATPLQVRNFIISGISKTHTNATVENVSDNSLTILLTRMHQVGLFGQMLASTENRATFTFLPQDDGSTQVTFNEVATAYNPMTGGQLSRPVGTAQSELATLNNIKIEFDGGYRFGYDVDNKKHKGGYPISAVILGSPADAAGLKVGQILLKVNGEKIKYDKVNDIFNFVSGIDYPKTDVLTVMDSSGAQRDISITSWFMDPKKHMFVKPE